ncbi:MAG: fibronectin type III domain-containing protein [bacterium]
MKNLKKYVSFLFVLSVTLSLFLVDFNKAKAVDTCPGTPTVSYGGKTYDTVLIGTQCWLKQSLNIGTKILGTQLETNNSVIEKYCYNDLDANCDTYGGLYDWAEAVQYKNGATNTTNWSPVPTTPVQGICPQDWHIPTNAEWGTLQTYLGGINVAGGKIKEIGTAHFLVPNLGATNSSGFTSVGSGTRWNNGTFNNLNKSTGFWTTTAGANPATDVYYGGATYSAEAATNGQLYKSQSSSVRCLRTEPTTVPGLVTNLTGVYSIGGTQAVLTWTAPINNGGSPITSYLVEYKQVSSTTWLSTTSTATTKTITGLVNGNSYDYRVSAINAIGTSPAVSITAPSQVTGLMATPGIGKVTLNWNVPNNGGSSLTNYIINYKLTKSDPNSIWSSITIPSTSTSTMVAPLTNGKMYDFRVRAIGSSYGLFSAVVSSTPNVPIVSTVPNQPSNLSGVFITDHVDLSWSAPSNNGGSPVTSYFIEYKQLSATKWSNTTSTVTTKKISGLLGGLSYEYKVSAINAIGTGPAVSITAPSQVTGLIATPGIGKVTLNWKVPNNGGSSLTEYRLRYKLASATEWFPVVILSAKSNTYTITGLSRRENYSFRVRAWGSSAGPWSEIVSTSTLANIQSNNLVANPIEAEIFLNQNDGTVLNDVNTFSILLNYRTNHKEVKRLQEVLNNLGYVVANNGVGSTGKETDFFGKATKSALIKFQKDHNIKPANGDFDSQTKNEINKVIQSNM